MSTVLKIACNNSTPQFPTQFTKEGLDFLVKCLQRDLKMSWTSEELLNHPFVSGNSEGNSLRKKDAFSPASVLDVETCEEDDYESDFQVFGAEFHSQGSVGANERE
ncbi:hypothetical protein HHK36_009224 [Tetracentron sinense]|uniref:Uncharacterized protein n=1 Tax=Tetracentron sinense TaxID=13715 RepID=A0A835DI77_TETSI|nr:hypothetical protein HHK36_009224 [Tetracentron sinense]